MVVLLAVRGVGWVSAGATVPSWMVSWSTAAALYFVG
jgi:hypothetical protein